MSGRADYKEANNLKNNKMNKTFIIIHNYNVKPNEKFKFKHSQCTIIQVSLVVGLPTPLSAVHL